MTFLKTISIALISLAIVSCQNSKSVDAGSRGPSTGPIVGPPVELGETWTSKDTENSDKIVQLMRNKLVQDTGSERIMKRDAHPKHHGCVKASLTIDNSKLDEQFRVGLFAQNAQYESFIRFSNGSPDPKKADVKGDARGIAVKILNVPYQSYMEQIGLEENDRVHDLVFMNSPVFFNESSENYVKMVKASMGNPFRLFFFAVTNLRALAILAKTSSMKVANPLDIDYHSAVPYKLGTTSMRMSFKSCKNPKDTIPKKPHENFLGLRLAEYLKDNGNCFDFYLQPNRDPKRNKVEQPMDAWDIKRSPEVYVGKLTIDKQDGVRSEARQEVCENITYNPWRAPIENRPMGVVNRIRLDVYARQSIFRLEHSGTPVPRPQSLSDIP